MTMDTHKYCAEFTAVSDGHKILICFEHIVSVHQLSNGTQIFTVDGLCWHVRTIYDDVVKLIRSPQKGG